MTKDRLLYQTNRNLQQLLEAALDYAVLLNNGSCYKTEPFRRILLNKYNALRKSNIRNFETWEENIFPNK